MSVQIDINGQTVQATAGKSLFAHAEDLGVRVPTSCGQQGKCRECLVEVVEGMKLLSSPTSEEQHLQDGFRLSCRSRIVDGAGVVRCHTLRRGQMRIERQAFSLPTTGKRVPLDPAVSRQGDRVLIDGREVGCTSGPIHGMAMDLGTTTIVLRLFDLETGELVADGSLENPQRFGGSDVMSRIRYDAEHRGKLLMRTLAAYLTHAIEELPVDPATIFELTVAGNSTMRDLFFGHNVYSIGQSPYQSITEIEMAEGKRTTTSLTSTGRHCLLPIHPQARVYGLPIISGHLGADAAACMLAVDLANEERLTALMDIGTNTELIVGNRHRILAASCPAGPAFEGGAIACGMPGLEGAIESVALDSDGSFRLGVIGGSVPEGICGSGLIDLMSELIRLELMNERGRFQDDARRITLDEQRDVYFLESDVNELAQAKGANVAGLYAVFSNFGIEFDDLDVFYLAGGFGRRLRVDAAKRIGLIPDIADSKIVQIGNASIEGASIALLSMTKRAELEALVKKVQHCRLETHPRFFDFFVEGCQFKPVQSHVAGVP